MNDLVSRAQKGDSTALCEIVRAHYDAVCSFCMRRVGRDLGQDAAQETFVVMQKSIRRFRGDSTLRAWLLGIANNQCMSLARKNRRESAPLEEWLEVKGNDPTNSIVDREELRKALLKLSQEHRDVVLMHEIEGLKYAEIAGVLGIPEGTVKSRLHHAFRSLRQSLVGAMS